MKQEATAGFQGEVSRVLRGHKKGWKSYWHLGAHQVAMEILWGQGRASAVCWHEEGTGARLKWGSDRGGRGQLKRYGA